MIDSWKEDGERDAEYYHKQFEDEMEIFASTNLDDAEACQACRDYTRNAALWSIAKEIAKLREALVVKQGSRNPGEILHDIAKIVGDNDAS